MKIAVNTRLLLKDRLEGIGHFTAEIFQRLVKDHPEVDWYFIFDRPYHSDFIYDERIKTKVIFPPTRHPVLWHLWFQWSLPRFLRKEKIDLFISPDGMIPLYGKTRSISVIHDLNYEHQPQNLDPVAGGYMRKYYPKFAQRANRLVTVSEYCKQDLHKTYKLKLDKIDVVPNASGNYLKPLALPLQVEVQKQYAHGEDYFLHLGALNPRKNLEGLMLAYQHYRSSEGRKKLLIVGEKMLWTKELEEAFQNNPYKEDIIFTGRLTDLELSRVLASATALCMVSHFEGFGIPILEAFSCDCPVICANNTAMPEVAGEAALYVDSRDADSIAKAMHLIEDLDLRQSLIEQGRKQKLKFSWNRSATLMWSSILKALDNG